LTFDLIFQSEPRVPSFQMRIAILSGTHKKRLVLEQIHRSTQIIGSARFSARVVKKYSVCESSDQKLGFEAQGPLMFEYHNRGDIMGTIACARTYNLSHLSRTIISYLINMMRYVVKKGPFSITPLQHAYYIHA